LLSNLSRSDEIKKLLLEFNREEEFRGINFGFMLGWFNHPKLAPIFHFFANILANVSSFKDTREFIMLPKVKLLESITTSILSIESNRRQGTLKALRNCLFEYENEQTLEYILTSKVTIFNQSLQLSLG
jgi:hypothetical protein